MSEYHTGNGDSKVVKRFTSMCTIMDSLQNNLSNLDTKRSIFWEIRKTPPFQ